MALPKRKHPRMDFYDYGAGGVFSLTLCTVDKKCTLGYIAQAQQPHVSLSALGQLVKQSIDRIPLVYPGVSALGSVIMPNHVHFLLEISPERPVSLFTIIRSTKAPSQRSGDSRYGSDRIMSM